MMKYIFFLLLSIISIAPANGSTNGISKSDLEALKVIGARQGLARLDYDESSGKWGYFGDSKGVIDYIRSQASRFWNQKDRTSILKPLENLTNRIEEGYQVSIKEDSELFHQIRRAYSSLTSLYSFYKINPGTNKEKQESFVQRFPKVLDRLKTILENIETLENKGYLYKPMPWFGDEKNSLETSDQCMDFHYIDMNTEHLSTLNNQLKSIGNNSTKIDRAMEFYPTWSKESSSKPALGQILQKKPVIFIVHGTFAADSPEYTSDKNILFQQTKYVAQSIANELNFPVEVYSFGWSGVNDNVERMQAGVELANFVNTYFPQDEFSDVYIGHSHGGNVIFHFTKVLGHKRTPEMVVTLATPIRKDFISHNVNYLFQFYSTVDMVQYAGSYEMTNRSSSNTSHYEQHPRKVNRTDLENMGYFKDNDKYEQVKIYSSEVLLNGSAPSGVMNKVNSHSNLKYLIGTLPVLIQSLMEHPANGEYVLDIKADMERQLSITEMDRLRFKILNR